MRNTTTRYWIGAAFFILALVASWGLILSGVDKNIAIFGVAAPLLFIGLCFKFSAFRIAWSDLGKVTKEADAVREKARTTLLLGPDILDKD